MAEIVPNTQPKLSESFKEATQTVPLAVARSIFQSLLATDWSHRSPPTKVSAINRLSHEPNTPLTQLRQNAVLVMEGASTTGYVWGDEVVEAQRTPFSSTMSRVVTARATASCWPSGDQAKLTIVLSFANVVN